MYIVQKKERIYCNVFSIIDNNNNTKWGKPINKVGNNVHFTLNVIPLNTNNLLSSSTYIQSLCPDRSHPMHMVTELHLNKKYM